MLIDDEMDDEEAAADGIVPQVCSLFFKYLIDENTWLSMPSNAKRINDLSGIKSLNNKIINSFKNEGIKSVSYTHLTLPTKA